MAEVKFIPFTEFAPDQRLIGGEVLHEAKNAVPLFGQYRLVNKLSPVGSSTASTEPPTGSHSQLIVEEVTVQYLRPESDDAVNNSKQRVPEDKDVWEVLDEEIANEGDYVITDGANIKVNLSEVDDPASSTGHIIRYRYKVSEANPAVDYIVLMTLREGSTFIAEHEESSTTSAEGDSDWTLVEYTLTALEADAITDYSNLNITLQWRDSSGTNLFSDSEREEIPPVEDTSTGSWTKQDGTTSSLFEAINEDLDSPDHNDYIRSKVLTPGQQDIVKFKFDEFKEIIGVDEFDISFEWYNRCSQPSCELLAKIYSGSDVITLSPHLSTNYLDPVNSLNNFDAVDMTTSNFDRDEVLFSKPLFIEFIAKMPQEAEFTETSFVSPNNSNNVLLSWSDGVGTTDVHEAVDETVASDVDFITSLATNSEIDLDFASFTDPLTDTGFIINVRARVGAGPGSTLEAELYSGNTKVGVTTNPTLTGGFTTFALPVTAIKPFDTTNLSIKLTTNGAGVDVSYVSLEYPTPARVDISALRFHSKETQRIQWSWVEMEVPSTVTEFVPDRESFFVGNKTSIFKFDGNTFDDVSNSSGYGAGTFSPLAWNFVQWGNDVIATNYVDPVQILEEGSADFVDLITSTETPKARFVAVISNHLILANINHTGHFPDELWWSGIDDATDFDPDITTGSDFQRLLPTPGGITGIVGGAEFGYVFKENSIYRLNYVGYPLVFTPHVIAHEGTKYSKSIVRVGNDVYFFGNGGFRKLFVGGEIIPIGDLKVTKFLLDSEFESNYLLSPAGEKETQTQNNIIGWYDKISRLIFWAYRGPEDSPNQLNHCIVYNPSEDKWGRIEDTLNISAAGSILNNSLEDSFIHRGAYIFVWDGSNISFSKFSSSTTYESELTTSVMALEPGNNVTVLFIRPVWTPYLNSGNLPNLEITILSGNEPTLTSETTTTVVDYNQANEDGWIPCTINGEFFKFTMTVPELSGQSSKEFSGIQLKLSPEYPQQRF